MARTSKYLHKTFDNNWTCTHVGIARVQAKKKLNGKGASRWPGHQTYYYIFERPTSDGKALKLVRLNAAEASKVYQGVITVEEIAEARAVVKPREFSKKISYHFTDNDRN